MRGAVCPLPICLRQGQLYLRFQLSFFYPNLSSFISSCQQHLLHLLMSVDAFLYVPRFLPQVKNVLFPPSVCFGGEEAG